MIEAFIDEALIVLEDGILSYVEMNKVKIDHEHKIYSKADREVLELEESEKILRKCIIHDLKHSITPPTTGTEHNDSDEDKPSSFFRKNCRENEPLSLLNNLAKDVKYEEGKKGRF